MEKLLFKDNMLNRNIFNFLISLLFVLFSLQGCSESSPDEVVINTLIDIDPTANQVTELLTKNGDEVGLIISVAPSQQVRYQLLDSAGGRFIIDESTGVVYLADQLLLNAHLLPSHSITVQANYADGSFNNKVFDVAVTPPYFDTDNITRYDNDIAIVSQFNLLLDWNGGNGQEFNGWTWSKDVAYGNPGWLLDEDGPLGGGAKYTWGWGVRSFNKSDYGKENTALIDSSNRAPSTETGGSLLVTETEASKDHRSTWWLWYDGKPLSDRGVTKAKTDRMSFYLKTNGMAALIDDGGKESLKINFHIGTYLCWNTDNKAWGQGDGCPYEGVGNQHYYHTLSINSGAWIHVLLDQHPQKRRNVWETVKNNPAWAVSGKNYFEQLSRFYFEIRSPQEQKTSFNVDELKYFSTIDMVEPNQNEESITSLWVGFWSDKDVWEIGFHDESYEKYNDYSNSTYQIRWSTSPITNENFKKANIISPLFYSGVEVAGADSDHLIRRANGWESHAWTRFKLPDHVENNYKKLFFAVKDISVKGSHIGSAWPYNKGDGHNAPSDNIKTIDYYLR
jgi:hypothetical protein